MNPLTLGVSVIGIGMQAYGSFSASEDAHKVAGIQKDIAADEMQINAQKQTQMNLEAHRQIIQNFRNVQRARAAGTAAAVNQGAAQGSGLQGGNAQNTAQGFWNNSGINQNQAIGNTIFGINDAISNKKMQLADAQADMYSDQALSSFGGTLVKDGGTIGNLGKNLFSGT